MHIIRVILSIYFFLVSDSRIYFIVIFFINFITFYSMKPTLKKVSKYENKFAKLQKKAAEFNFRNQLKQVKKKEFTLEEEDKEVRTIVFNRIFASRRREYYFFLIVFFLARQRPIQTFFEFIKTRFCRDTSWNFLSTLIYLCISKYVLLIFHSEYVYICIFIVFVHFTFLRISFYFVHLVFLRILFRSINS